MESQRAERLPAAPGRGAQLADNWWGWPQAIRHVRRDGAGTRRHKQDDVVIVRVIENPRNPGRIGQARIRQSRQKRLAGQDEEGDQSPPQQPPERERTHDQY